MRSRASRTLAGHQRGFTLIEVLLTTVLAAVLLAGLWTLLSMHMRLFDTGRTKTEQSQLARTLLKQMSDDIRGVVLPPPMMPIVSTPNGLPMVGAMTTSAPTPGQPSGGQVATAPPGAVPSPPSVSPSTLPQPSVPSLPAAPGSTAATRRTATAGTTANMNSGLPVANSASPAIGQVGGTTGANLSPTAMPQRANLLGTESYLQIDVAQPTATRRIIDDDRSRSAKLGPRAEELRTIIYAFEENRDANRAPGESRPALVRREVRWEDSHGAPSNNLRSRPRVVGTSGAGTADASQPLDRRVPDELNTSSETAPEVAQLGIRYFDGAQWSVEWDSAARQGLPVAIEVALQLWPFDELEPSHHLANEVAVEEPRAKRPAMPVYRLTIQLPTSYGSIVGARGVLGDSAARGAKPPLEADAHGSLR